VPSDTPTRWAMSLRSVGTDAPGTPLTLTASITPRRAQAFVMTPDETYRWQNQRLDNGQLVASGVASADASGLLTIPDVIISPTGNRLTILAGNDNRLYLPGILR